MALHSDSEVALGQLAAAAIAAEEYELAIQTAEAKIQAEIDKVMQAMRNDYQQALAQEQSLTNALEQQKRK